jgi:hypothetical protein
MENSSLSDRAGRLTEHLAIGVLTRTVPRFLVDEVLTESGRSQKRSRLLPAHVVVYFVMALALFRDGYEEVIRHLVHGLRFSRTWSRVWTVPSTGAMSQARVRLGEAPMRELFTRVARPLAKDATPGAWLGQWRLMAIDAVMLDIAETAANLAVYEKSDGGTRRPYPQVKVVALAECGTHAVLDAQIGSIRNGERELAAPLSRSLDTGMLVLADRGFFSFELWRGYLSSGADLLWRLTKTTHLPVLTALPDGSYLSEIKRHQIGKTRISIDNVDDPMLATHIPVRVIEYQVDTGADLEIFRVITTILDPDLASAPDLAATYSQRWELETSFRELECQLLAHATTLRSKTPEMVRQEIWGLFLTHYAIRSFIADAADTIDLDPDRISTIRAINIIRRTITDSAGFSPLSQQPGS